jgi:hypothetical protein
MIAADSGLDESLARKVCEALPQQPLSTADSLLKDQVELIFHAVFGDRDAAVVLAESLAHSADNQELSPASASAQLVASLALRITDPRESDTSKLERFYDRSLASSMYEAAIRTSARIGSIKYDDGAVDLARFWGARASELVARTDAQRLSTDYLTLQIDLALARGDIRSARQLIDNARHYCPIYAAPRWSRSYLVYRLRVTQHEGESAGPTQDIECLLEWHNRAKHLGRHDDDMEVLWTALWRLGKRIEASSLLREYLFSARRERRSPSFVLRSRTREDPVWNEFFRNKAILREDPRVAIHSVGVHHQPMRSGSVHSAVEGR